MEKIKNCEFFTLHYFVDKFLSTILSLVVQKTAQAKNESFYLVIKNLSQGIYFHLSHGYLAVQRTGSKKT